MRSLFYTANKYIFIYIYIHIPLASRWLWFHWRKTFVTNNITLDFCHFVLKTLCFLFLLLVFFFNDFFLFFWVFAVWCYYYCCCWCCCWSIRCWDYAKSFSLISDIFSRTIKFRHCDEQSLRAIPFSRVRQRSVRNAKQFCCWGNSVWLLYLFAHKAMYKCS